MGARNRFLRRPVKERLIHLLKRLPFSIVLVLVLVASASTWIYVARVLKPQQVADAVAHNRPRGNLSDLYPRWLGARELLLHGRNPYNADITREIQQGYYGRPLDPSRPDDPKDQQGFAYPVYVVFLLAPTVNLPFEVVQVGFRWLLFGAAVAVVLLTLCVLKWEVSCRWCVFFIVATLGWLPVVQGIKLQQLSLVVAGLLAGSAACVVSGWLLCAGALLALATIKPQLTWPMVLWLLLWVISDLRSRRKVAIGFGLVMALLLGGAEFLLPGWLRLFVQAIGQYHQYTQNQSVLVWMFGTIFGRAAEVMSVLACGIYVWKARCQPASSAEFGISFALVMALTVVVVPMFAPYNQILLVPAILLLVRNLALGDEPILPAIRLACVVGAILLAWPWIATLLLSAVSPWLTDELRNSVWPMPFYSNFVLPIFVFGLTLLTAWMSHDSGLRANGVAE
jgi:Glycosyltransferase family 87